MLICIQERETATLDCAKHTLVTLFIYHMIDKIDDTDPKTEGAFSNSQPINSYTLFQSSHFP